MSELHDRIIEISKKYHLAHLGSTLTAVNIIDEIYKTKQHDEKFILSAGHVGLALYVVIEKYEGVDAESIYLHHGVHPDRCEKCHLYCSTGSLGNGLPIALGMAMADRTKNVYCLISDGEAFEGTIWESANIMRKYSVTNLKVYLNFNGFSAYDIVDKWMIDNLKTIMPIEVRRTDVEDYGLEGLSAHYITL
jgi:transketolase N-terminal domain/subunit